MSISIVEFSVENFKIFKEKVTFSMLTKKSVHSFAKKRKNLLKVSLIYGPNASGKSSLLNAFNILKGGIINSVNNEDNVVLPYFPFLLSDVENKSSFYEVIFFLEEDLFRYNFSMVKGEILTENLFRILTTGEEKQYLRRKKQDIRLFDKFKNAKDIIPKTRKEALFISVASKWNHVLSMKIVNGFKDINLISGVDQSYLRYTGRLFRDNPEMKKKILTFLKQADFCINDGIAEKISVHDLLKDQMATRFEKIPEEMDTVYFFHNKFDSKSRKIGREKFNIGEESDGTQKYFSILGPIIDTLENGKVLLVDEFDNSLHPLLTKYILDLFEKKNPKNAQLIVTTHDTSLLSYKNDFIKDQVWFTEKNKYGCGRLFSLAEFNMPLRNDTEFSKKYLEGRFGALPFIQS